MDAHSSLVPSVHKLIVEFSWFFYVTCRLWWEVLIIIINYIYVYIYSPTYIIYVYPYIHVYLFYMELHIWMIYVCIICIYICVYYIDMIDLKSQDLFWWTSSRSRSKVSPVEHWEFGPPHHPENQCTLGTYSITSPVTKPVPAGESAEDCGGMPICGQNWNTWPKMINFFGCQMLKIFVALHSANSNIAFTCSPLHVSIPVLFRVRVVDLSWPHREAPSAISDYAVIHAAHSGERAHLPNNWAVAIGSCLILMRELYKFRYKLHQTNPKESERCGKGMKRRFSGSIVIAHGRTCVTCVQEAAVLTRSNQKSPCSLPTTILLCVSIPFLWTTSGASCMF
jgi:hypothetical protein